MLVGGVTPPHFKMPAHLVNLKERSTFASSAQSPVDRTACTISDVKLLGPVSRNGRTYTPECIAKAVPLYEGARVYLDHGNKSVSGVFGTIRGPYPKDGSIFCKHIHYNPHLPLSEAMLWNVINAPHLVGMSHDADVRMDRDKVTEIAKVNSVDLVSDPATTKGVFESMDPSLAPGGSSVADLKPATPDADMELDAGIGELAKQIFTSGLSKGEKAKKLKALLKLCGDDKGGDEPAEDDEPADEPEADAEPKDEADEPKDEKAKESVEVEKLRKELDTYRAREAYEANKTKAVKLCESLGLPAPARTDYFVSLLAGLPTEKAVREAIEDRKAGLTATSAKRPTSAPPSATKPLSLDTFCTQLTSVNE